MGGREWPSTQASDQFRQSLALCNSRREQAAQERAEGGRAGPHVRDIHSQGGASKEEGCSMLRSGPGRVSTALKAQVVDAARQKMTQGEGSLPLAHDAEDNSRGLGWVGAITRKRSTSKDNRRGRKSGAVRNRMGA